MKESLESKKKRAISIIKILRKATKGMPDPASVAIVKKYGQDPYLVLIGCLLSLRAKDAASLPASLALFKKARTPYQMITLPIRLIEKIIYLAGFYRKKARQVKEVSIELIERFEGRVPGTYEELISIKGVGPKTANLVLGEAFGKPALYVDVHVHRISNRLGLVRTKKPEETQIELERIVPKRYWNEYSRLLVTWGQNICVPISPFCSKCAIYDKCQRVDVKRHR